MKAGEFLTRHRNAFLLALLGATLTVSGYANQQSGGPAAVDIPVVETAAQAISPLESYRQRRDQDALADMAALERLCAQENLDSATREAAAAQLQEIVANRQAQSALEGALVNSSLAPCVAVAAGGCLTVVTEKSAVTEQDSARVIALAAAHAGIAPENVRIITAK